MAAQSTYSFKVDGYAIGERLLEGVMFDVTVTGDPAVELTVASVTPASGARAYLATLNEAMWLSRATDYVEDLLAEVVGPDGHALLTDLNADGTIEL